MKSSEIRERFIQFFKKEGHQHIQSSSLIPQNDPTLLFANAGMNQFKEYFTGQLKSPYSRAVSVQKCVRAGGKHNDLENVGLTARHHTFFEMLGNFSFGNYFKEEAIRFGWDFLTKDLKIDANKLYVTVHISDDEALKIWNEKIGIPKEKIFKKDKDNFWEMGEFGPCGPCSEIFFDHGSKYATPNFTPKAGEDILDDGLRYVEIWNLVFMQYEKTQKGTQTLPAPSIDTGAGLERLSAVMQNCYWNYDTDCFTPLINKIESLTSKSAKDAKYASNIRVVADHIRGATMLITDGVIPSNEGRGYVLRRIIRRAIRHLRELETKEILFHKLVPTVFDILGGTYPTNKNNEPLAIKFLELEESKFLETLDQGLRFLEEAYSKVNNKILPGAIAFQLHDTFGFPLDLTEVISKEKGITVDVAEFDSCMKKQQELSKKSWKGAALSNNNQQYNEIFNKFGASKFSGYEKTIDQGKLLAIIELSPSSSSKEVALIFDNTPFYAESGGQIGDKGTIVTSGTVGTIIAKVTDTLKPLEGLIVHIATEADLNKLQTGNSYTLCVDLSERKLIQRNHTATHLLQKALTTVLGDHIKQAGSAVTPHRLRFDFTHFTAMKDNEISRVEEMVNKAIKDGLEVDIQNMKKDKALKTGAVALFGEKYAEEVRVVNIKNYSTELCGGTHVTNTQEIGIFSIVAETALSSGVRRIEALTSTKAIERLLERSSLLEQIEVITQVKTQDIPHYIENIKVKIKDMDKEIKNLNDKIQDLESGPLFDNPEIIKDKYAFKQIKINPGQDLKKFSDKYMDKYPNGILILYQQTTGDKLTNKVSVLLRVSKTVTTVDCSTIIKKLLPLINGNGGGRKDFSQGSGEITNDQTGTEKINKFLLEIKKLLLESV
ncbi:MAG: alanine--tRNA ligase [Oligoflexia bacterium]|nr:alanine--tRNA ligase [Oligoflexia bacterium]